MEVGTIIVCRSSEVDCETAAKVGWGREKDGRVGVGAGRRRKVKRGGDDEFEDRGW